MAIRRFFINQPISVVDLASSTKVEIRFPAGDIVEATKLHNGNYLLAGPNGDAEITKQDLDGLLGQYLITDLDNLQ